jgi:hypothetical protein
MDGNPQLITDLESVYMSTHVSQDGVASLLLGFTTFVVCPGCPVEDNQTWLVDFCPTVSEEVYAEDSGLDLLDVNKHFLLISTLCGVCRERPFDPLWEDVYTMRDRYGEFVSVLGEKLNKQCILLGGWDDVDDSEEKYTVSLFTQESIFDRVVGQIYKSMGDDFIGEIELTELRRFLGLLD